MQDVCTHPKPCNKRSFYFKAELTLVDITFHLPRGGDLTFECQYCKNTISSKGFHQLSHFLPNLLIQETIQIPFQAIYDKRKQVFFCEPLIINILNMHQSFRKKLGFVKIDLSEILNSKMITYSSTLKIEKTIDKEATLKLNLNIKYLGNTDYAKNNMNVEESYFQENSLGFCKKKHKNSVFI